MQATDGYWFKSSLFQAEPGEDEETNPRMYGRQLANWICERFRSLGYPAEVFAEDWGWCVLCQRGLLIGCVNLQDIEYAEPGDPPPPKERLLWHVAPMAETRGAREGLERLDTQLRTVLESEPAIEIVDETVVDAWFADLPRKLRTPEAAADQSTIPRWLQVIFGALLLPLTLLCVGGSLTIFTIPKVQKDPFAQLFAAVICLLCAWGVIIAVRLLFGLRGKHGLLGPLALRLIALAAIGLVAGAFFTGAYLEYPLRTAALGVFYVAVAIRFWKLAARRSQG